MNDQVEALRQFAADELGIKAKPEVLLPGNGVTFSDTATRLYELAAAQNALFYSNGTVVSLVPQAGAILPKLVALLPSAALTEFEKYATFVRTGKKPGDLKFEVMNESTAKAILASDIARQKLANVQGLLNRPIPVLRGGTVDVLRAGYNPAEKLLVADGTIDEPETLEEALELIMSVIIDCSFQSESDMSRAIACLLTPALKMGGFIKDDTPIHVVEAEESQTGKGVFIAMRDAIYGEKGVLITKTTGGVGSLDESLSTALFSGRPFILLDNLRGKLDSSLLESFLTNPGELMVRIPYSAAKTLDGSFRFVSITSNGVEATEDLTNRASFIRLVKEKDRVFTTVAGKSIPQIIQEKQPKYMGAITKVIRFYHSQGMPRTPERRHARLEWAQKLDWIVQNIFGMAPLMDGHEIVQKRANTKDLSFIRAIAIAAEKSGKLGQEMQAQDLAELCQAAGIEIPGLNNKAVEDYPEGQEARQIGSLMRKAFGMDNELEADGFCFTRTERSKHGDNGNIFKSKFYEFRRLEESGLPYDNDAEPEGLKSKASKASKTS